MSESDSRDRPNGRDPTIHCHERVIEARRSRPNLSETVGVTAVDILAFEVIRDLANWSRGRILAL